MPLTLVGKIKEADLTPIQVKAKVSEEVLVHINPRRARRNWSVLLDRYLDLSDFVALHGWVSEWLSIGPLEEVQGYRASIGMGLCGASPSSGTARSCHP